MTGQKWIECDPKDTREGFRMNISGKEKNLTVGFSFIQGFYWMSFAAIMGFSSLYLLDNGFSNTEIGIIIAISGIISAVLQPLLASYADKPESMSLKNMILGLSGIQLLLGIMLFLSYQKLLVFTGVFYGCLVTILQLMLPLINSLGMESLNQGKKLNFGLARGMGSAAYAIAAYALGIFVADLGARFVPISILAAYSVFLVSLLCLFPFEKAEKKNGESVKKSSGSPIAFLHRYKRFGIVLVGCILVYISHVLLNSFTFQIVESKGGGSTEMGFAMALASLIELPTLFLFSFMLKKVRCDIWFRISGIFFMLKSLGTLLAPTIPVFYGVQVFQLMGWALITVSSVYYVNAIMDQQDAIKGQAYMTMTYTIGSVVAAFLGGALIDLAGVNAMLLFATVCAALGMMIMLLAAEKAEEIPE